MSANTITPSPASDPYDAVPLAGWLTIGIVGYALLLLAVCLVRLAVLVSSIVYAFPHFSQSRRGIDVESQSNLGKSSNLCGLCARICPCRDCSVTTLLRKCCPVTYAKSLD